MSARNRRIKKQGRHDGGPAAGRKYAARFLLVTTLASDHLSSLRQHPVPASAKSMARKTFQWPRKKSTVPSDRPNKALESDESRAITAA
jgi:hypothetical protein